MIHANKKPRVGQSAFSPASSTVRKKRTERQKEAARENGARSRGPKTIAGRDGFEAITDDGKGKVNHLVSIVPAGDRIYMLVSAGPRGHATSDDAERFRSSFRVTDGEPATTGSTSTPSP